MGDSPPFSITKINGTEGPKTTILTTKAPGQDGKSYHGTLLEERIISIEGDISGGNIEDMYKKRQQLCSVFNPKLVGTLTYINDSVTYCIKCTAQDSPIFKDKLAHIQHFLIQLFCADPYWKDLIEVREEMAQWVGDFQFPLEIPQETGITIGHRVSTLIANCFNDRDAECSIRVEFKALASVVNPSILNVYTQEYIKVKRTLTAGDKLIIDTSFGNKRVEMVKTDGTTSNVFNYIDLNSTFLQLDIGDNLLRYDAESGIDNLEVGIYYTQKYVGV